MKKNQVNAIFNSQTNRRRKIACFGLAIIVLFIITLMLFVNYVKEGKGYLVNYKEKSDVDYKVYLKENEFYADNFLDSNNRYIASLIDYINASFRYEISMEEKDVKFDYTYRIEAEVSVKESTGSKPLFTKKYDIVSEQKKSSEGRSNVVINENIKIDYNEYNDLIKKFVNIYGLSDTDSTLVMNMYVDVNGSCEEFNEDSNNSTVISLVVPLTTKTVGVDIKNDILETSDNVMICKNQSSLIVFKLILGLITLAGCIYLTIMMIKYIKESRTAKTVYDVELKKILNYYHSYIQKVKNQVNIDFDNTLEIDGIGIYKNCQLFVLNSFTDMLEIRDSLNTPILMSTNNENTETYFIILDALNKAVYVYELKVNNK